MPELQPGDPRRLGSYEIVERLGEGGQGVVYAGVDASGNKAAIKLLRADLAGDTIFVFAGDDTTVYDGGLELEEGQRLLGPAAGLTFPAPSGTLIPPGQGRPRIGNTAGDALTLAGDTTVSGIDIETTTGRAVTATGLLAGSDLSDMDITNSDGAGIHLVGNDASFEIADVSLTTTGGPALDIARTTSVRMSGSSTLHATGDRAVSALLTDLDVRIPAMTSLSSPTGGIHLDAVSGVVEVDSVTLTGVTGGATALEVRDASASLSFTTTEVGATDGNGVVLRNLSGSTQLGSLGHITVTGGVAFRAIGAGTVVLDTAPAFDEQTLTALDETDECIIVATLDHVGLRFQHVDQRLTVGVKQ